jgi:rRNA-processing protein CGR1
MVKKKVICADGAEKVPRGVAKSGRFWKESKEKFRKIQNSLPKKSKEQHQKFREEMKNIKALSKSIKEEKKQVGSI